MGVVLHRNDLLERCSGSFREPFYQKAFDRKSEREFGLTAVTDYETWTHSLKRESGCCQCKGTLLDYLRMEVLLPVLRWTALRWSVYSPLPFSILADPGSIIVGAF